MNILTFDIEEWFHILDNDSTKTVREWQQYESRIHSNVDRILSILAKHDQQATFFCLGWIAERYPEVIRKISDLGYEIGSHSYMHQLVYEQDRQSFFQDTNRSIKMLEDTIGKKVKYFRASGFSIREDATWSFDILGELGIEVDCSIFPAPRSHGGFPSYAKPVPSIIEYNGFRFKELPINYVTWLNQHIIFSGGGYFRAFPYWLIKYWTRNSDYVMSYLHPRDFDPQQPIIKELSLVRKLKSYVGLKQAENKLDKWLADFEFVDMRSAIKSIDWDHVPIIDLYLN